MRKLTILAATAALTMSLFATAGAQKPSTGTQKPGTNSTGQKAPSGQPKQGERRRMMGSKFMEELKLTAAQKTKIEAIMKKQGEAMKALRNQRLTEDERMAKYRALRDSTNKQIRAVLTAAQQKKWDEQMKKMQEMRGRMGGPGGPGGAPSGMPKKGGG